MPNCGGLTGSDHRRAEHLSARQAGLLSFIAPTSRAESARYGAPTVFSSPPVECFSTERTRISYFALLATTTYAALLRESRMQFINATSLHRKSGGAQWRDLLFSGLLLRMFFDRADPDFLLRAASDGHVCGSPQREPHGVYQRHDSPQEIRGSEVEGSAVQRTSPENVF